MCEHERNVADNLAQLDAIKALITPIKLSIHSKMSAASVQDSIAYSDINCVAELIGDNLVCSLVKYISAMHVNKFCHYSEYPENWWEAFKLRFFPKFLLKKYPVKYTVIDISIDRYVVCPHVQVLDRHRHYMWMLDAMKDEKNDN